MVLHNPLMGQFIVLFCIALRMCAEKQFGEMAETSSQSNTVNFHQTAISHISRADGL